MTPRHLVLAGAIALALSACGRSPSPPADTPAPAPAASPAAVDAAPGPAADAQPAQDAPATAATVDADAGGDAPAVVSDCATTLESNDAMRYSADAILVPASCTTFTIRLEHVGSMPVGAMGHNVVIAREADMRGIAADGMAVTPDHLKAGDPRVIAHSAMIGGGESTSVSFQVASIGGDGPYRFFCSFPGHLALMQGSLQVR